MERIAVVFRLNSSGLVNDRCQMHAVRRKKKRRKKPTSWRQHFTNLGKATNNMIREEVRKDGEREQVVKLFAEQTQFETIAYRQMRIFLSQTGEPDLMPACFDQRRINVQPVIVSRLQIFDRMNPATKRAAPDVKEPMAWLQTTRAQEFEL